MTWDTSLASYDILNEADGRQLIYYVVRMPLFITNRDLVERQSFRSEPNRVRIASQSAEGVPAKPKCERGKNYFRYQVMQHAASGTELHTVSQVDIAGAYQKKLVSLGTSAAASWADSLLSVIKDRTSKREGITVP